MKRKPPSPCPKYARKKENVHTSASNEKKTAIAMSKVCTKERKRAHFGKHETEKQHRHIRSMHERRKTCTLLQTMKRKPPSPCPKYARNSENMHTSDKLITIFVTVKHNIMIKDLYFAAGCFWGAQKYFKLLDGVVGTVVGYANGDTLNPTYKEVYTDTTGYAETVHVQYDTAIISIEFLVSMFFKAIDPMSLNKQGEDVGTRYRTGIYYIAPEDNTVIHDVYSSVEKEYGCELAVEVLPLKNFYTAEEMHQDYLDKNPEGYCHLPESLFEFARNAIKK